MESTLDPTPVTLCYRPLVEGREVSRLSPRPIVKGPVP